MLVLAPERKWSRGGERKGPHNNLGSLISSGSENLLVYQLTGLNQSLWTPFKNMCTAPEGLVLSLFKWKLEYL